MTRRRTGALPTVREICALIRMEGGEYVMLDADVAKLLDVSVARLNDRTWQKLAKLSEWVPWEWFVLELGHGRDPPLLYTLFGITEAITVVSDEPPSARASAILQRITQAFVKKDAGC
jgi:hypothetical protein